MDLQEQTRMLDVYKDVTDIIDKITDLPVFPSLVWVWTWDVTLNVLGDFEEDPEYKVNHTQEEVWAMFWRDADKNDFSLEYGTENLYESVRDWMIDTEIVTEALDEDEEDVVELTMEEV